MSLRNDLTDQLNALAGSAGWAVVAHGAVTVRVEVTAVETLGCQIAGVTLSAPTLASTSTAILKDWSDKLAERLTYLLESLGPLEVDEDAGQVLMRSATPQQTSSGKEYYELLLTAGGQDSVTLTRYESIKGVLGRTPVDMTLTRDVLGRLVSDLIDTMP